MTTRRVLISNAFPDDNKGGAAITQATIALAKEAFPGASIELLQVRAMDRRAAYRHTLDRFPDVVVHRPPLSGMPAPLRLVVSLLVLATGSVRFHRSLRPLALGPDDALVSKGGYVFVDRRGVRELLAGFATVFPILVALRRRARVVAIGATVGPFTSRLAARLSSAVLLRAQLVAVREEASFDAAAALGVDRERLVRYPDVAFTITRPDEASAAAAAATFGVAGERYAVFTTGNPPRFSAPERSAFVGDLARLADALADRRAVDKIVVIPHVLAADGSNETEDLRLSKELAARVLHRDAIVFDDADRSPAELIALYRGARLVVGGRMHAAIFSVIAGTPPLPVRFRFDKAANLFATLGLGDLVVDSDDVASAATVDLAVAICDGSHPSCSSVPLIADQQRNALLSICHRIATAETRATD